MKNNPVSLGAQNVKTCEHTLHLGKLEEVMREWHRKGQGKKRNSLPSRFSCGSLLSPEIKSLLTD